MNAHRGGRRWLSPLRILLAAMSLIVYACVYLANVVPGDVFKAMHTTAGLVCGYGGPVARRV